MDPDLHSAPVKWLAAWLFSLFAWLYVPAIARAESIDGLVQAPQADKPQRASLAGALASFSLSPEQLSRGSFNLPISIALPNERGSPLLNVLPVYSPDNGISEWGLGWATSLCISRMRLVGEVDYADDLFVTPWGRVERGVDGAYRPVGLTAQVVLRQVGAIWKAETSDTSFEFSASSGQSGADGAFSWCLSRASNVFGETTNVSYCRNELSDGDGHLVCSPTQIQDLRGRPLVDVVEYTGRGGKAAYRIRHEYEQLDRAIVSYRTGHKEVLNQRVARLRVDVRVGAAWKERWRYELGHSPYGAGAGFTLESVQRVFPSGAAEPAIRYSFGRSDDALALARWRTVEGLHEYLASVGDRGLQPTDASTLDVEEDGAIDIEHARTNALVHHTQQGWRFEALPPLTGTEVPECRSPPSANNRPRLLARLWDSVEPHVVGVSFANAPSSTSFLACNRAGRLISRDEVPGDWRPSKVTRLVDLNRDRRPDLLRIFPGGYEIRWNESSSGVLSFGAGASGPLSPVVTADTVWLNDINGDGLLDIVARWSAGLVVWYGIGRGHYVQRGEELGFLSRSGVPLTGLAEWSFSFLDVDRDGLSDLLLSRQGTIALFMNTGEAFVERAVPALDEMNWDGVLPVAADLSGTGEVEIATARGGNLFALQVSKASVGLLHTANDGKGGTVELEYERGPVAAGVGTRTAVLSRVKVSNNGVLQHDAQYEYLAPVPHSVGKQVVGYRLVRQTTSLGASEVHFDVDDSGARLVAAEDSVAGSDVVKFRTTAFEPYTEQGSAGFRPKVTTTGWRQGDEQASDTTTILAYERGICPVTTSRTTAGGTLVTAVALADVAQLRNQLHCLAVERSARGEHADSRLNFDSRVVLQRDPRGLVTEVVAASAAGDVVKQRVVYDQTGRVRELVSPDKGTTRVEYNDAGLLAAVIHPDGTVDRVAKRSPESDLILALVSERGATTKYATSFRFDAFERLEASWDNVGESGPERPFVRYSYVYGNDEAFGTIRTTTVPTSGSQIVAAEVFDARGTSLGTISTTDAGFVVESARRVDRLSGSSTVWTPRRSADGLPDRVDPQWIYAPRPVREAMVADPLEISTRSALLLPGGLTKRITKRRSVRSGLTEDLVETGTGERRTFRRAPDGSTLGIIDEAGLETTFIYDAQGRLAGVRDPAGVEHRSWFDSLGRATRIEHGWAGAVEYEYQPVTGRLAGKRFLSAEGHEDRRVTFGYDALGRVKLEQHQKAAAEDIEITFRYGTSADANEHGRLVETAGPGWRKRWKHRANGAIESEELTLAGFRTLSVTHTYFDDGRDRSRIWRIVKPSGETAHQVEEVFTLDAFGRVSTLRVNGQEALRFTYDGEGRPDTLSLATQRTLRFSYDDASHALTGWTSLNSPQSAFSWEVSPRGLVADERYGQPETHRQYEHEPRGFLKNVPSEALSYAYGPNGLPMRFEPRPSSTTADVAFDEMARVVGRPGITVRYGADGRIERATAAGREYRYSYDENRERISESSTNGVLAGYFNGASFTDSDLVVPVRALGRVVGVISGGEFRPLDTDPRGTTYGPHPPAPYGPIPDATGPPGSMYFAGHAPQVELGTFRMGARDYDPGLGVFWSPDPEVFENLTACVDAPVQCNLYGYAASDPVHFGDPDGRNPALVATLLWSIAPPPVKAAIVGATIGAGFEITRSIVDPNHKLDLGRVAAAGAGGATTGFAMGLLGPGGAQFSGVGRAGYVGFSFAMGRGVERAGNGERTTAGQFATDTLFGALLQAGAEKVFGYLALKIEAQGVAALDAAEGGLTVKPGKWDYFFGRVTSNPHNQARSLQNLKDLNTLGFDEAAGGREALTNLFQKSQGLPEAARHVTEHGVTITRTARVGDVGAIDIKYFYSGGDMSAVPEVSTIIPKVFK